jgi:hypothetical protein
MRKTIKKISVLLTSISQPNSISTTKRILVTAWIWIVRFAERSIHTKVAHTSTLSRFIMESGSGIFLTAYMQVTRLAEKLFEKE